MRVTTCNVNLVDGSEKINYRILVLACYFLFKSLKRSYSKSPL